MNEREFLLNSVPEPNTGCHLWLGRLGGSGYGAVWFNGGERKAHRVAWEIANGAIPKGEGFHGTCVCHTCDVRSCVNPDHLFLGSHADNIEDCRRKGREYWGQQTHCVYGHPFTVENTYIIKRGRQCRTCVRRNSLEWYYRKKQKSA